VNIDWKENALDKKEEARMVLDQEEDRIHKVVEDMDNTVVILEVEELHREVEDTLVEVVHSDHGA
jgi:hypothetical protein